jgi:peptidoglycan/xylan/chitin deacetylase (PgdA/CDA1 family)
MRLEATVTPAAPPRRPWQRLRVRRRAVVLLYHRVAETDSDPQLLCVSPQHFDEHMRVIRRLAIPIALDTLAEAARNDRVPRRGLAVTFDDGYADNLFNAKPVLQRHDVPATVFVASGHVGAQREFWWDDVERLMLSRPIGRENLDVSLGLCQHSFSLGPRSGRAAFEAADTCWDVTQPYDPTPRHTVYRKLQSLLKPAEPTARRRAIAKLAQTLGFDGRGRATHRAMTADEVRKLAEGDLVSIGAHTVTHPQLARRPLHEQRREIRECKAALETIVGRSVNSFSYPFGGTGDFDNTSVALVRHAGYRAACANVPGTVTARSDMYRLPRFLVRDWDGAEFAHRLRRMFRS